jgi:hypothetical protein
MRLYFLLLFILFITNCFTQDKFSKDDLLALTIPITSTPSSDFSDLTFLKSKIDTSLPIFLGESSHTIGDYNRLRVRMIKYLHEQLNYNVIAFEAPFANLKYVSENRNNLTVEKMLKMGLFYIWKTINKIFAYRLQVYSLKIEMKNRTIHCIVPQTSNLW